MGTVTHLNGWNVNKQFPKQDTRPTQSSYPFYHCQICGVHNEWAEDIGAEDIECEECFGIYCSYHEHLTTEWK